MRFFEDLTARDQHSAGRLGPQPFGGGWVDSQGERERRAVMRWRGQGAAALLQRLLPERPTPERCVEAYYLQRTRFESNVERKVRRRQLTEDGNVEIGGRDLDWCNKRSFDFQRPKSGLDPDVRLGAQRAESVRYPICAVSTADRALVKLYSPYSSPVRAGWSGHPVAGRRGQQLRGRHRGHLQRRRSGCLGERPTVVEADCLTVTSKGFDETVHSSMQHRECIKDCTKDHLRWWLGELIGDEPPATRRPGVSRPRYERGVSPVGLELV